MLAPEYYKLAEGRKGRLTIKLRESGNKIIHVRCGQEGVAIIKFPDPKSDFLPRARFFSDSLLYSMERVHGPHRIFDGITRKTY